MSRLIVKGLPKRYDERLLRDLFRDCAEVTDAKVVRTADGRSRQFGFVGFKNAEDAQSARHRLNRTYVDSSQVSVEVARPVGDAHIPRPWSKYSKGSSQHDKLQKRKERSQSEPVKIISSVAQSGGCAKSCEERNSEAENVVRGSGKNSSEFEEFRDVANKRSSTPLWVNDASMHGAQVKKSLVQSRKAGGSGIMLEKKHTVFHIDEEDGECDDMYEDLPQQGTVEYSEQPDSSEGIMGHIGDGCAADDLAADVNVDDMQYFKSKIRNDIDSDDTDSDDTDNAKHVQQEEVPKDCNLGKMEKAQARHETSVSESDSSDEYRSAKAERVAGSEDPSTAEHEVAQYDGDKDDEGSEFPSAGAEVDAAETGRLFVRNLSYAVIEDNLETLFEPFGTLSDVHVVQDARTKQSRGVAFVSYVLPQNAVKAMAALDGTVYFGRLLHILPGKQRLETALERRRRRSFVAGSNAFKEEREASRKEGAASGADSVAYNALYMSSDSVANSIADRLGLAKSDLYGTARGESGAAAVRLATGEAKLQAETRSFLVANGIDVNQAFSSSASQRRRKMSRVAFLVKNLPSRTSEETIYDMFSKFGSLHRIIVVPSGLVAVVLYASANDAKKAYSSMAYSRMKGSPLYLEWLPATAVKSDSNHSEIEPRLESADDLSTDNNSKAREVFQQDVVDGACPVLDGHAPQTTIFVKNINFDSTEDGLRKHFTRKLRTKSHAFGTIRAVSIAKKPNPKDPTGPKVSSGYGFVEFSNAAGAEEAMKILQGTSLEGHVLELQLAQRSGAKESDKGSRERKRSHLSASKRKPNSKVVVRNIAFEAAAKDLRHLFDTFGQVKSVRLPRRQDGTHRGFGFVEFISKNEAASAVNSLSATHLYGRHLVLDYADEGSDNFASMEELQAKAALQISKRRRLEGTSSPSGKLDRAAGDMQGEAMDDLYL